MKVGSNVGTLKLGSTAVAAIKRGTDRVYDADVATFQKASAAADVSGIMDLVDYLKTESLWNYARFYPMKSSQNAGTGSTVYGLGGLTSNNMTLVNSPTWGSDGVTFNRGSSQYGNVGDIYDGGDIYAAFQVAINASPPTEIESLAGTTGSFILWQRGDVAGDLMSAVRTSTGDVTGTQYSGTPIITSDSQTLSFVLKDGVVPRFFQGEGVLTTTGANITSTKNLSGDVYVGAVNNGGSPDAYFLSGVLAGVLFICGTGAAPSDGQHAQIATLLNAL